MTVDVIALTRRGVLVRRFPDGSEFVADIFVRQRLLSRLSFKRTVNHETVPPIPVLGHLRVFARWYVRRTRAGVIFGPYDAAAGRSNAAEHVGVDQ